MSKYGLFSGPYFPVFGVNTEIYGPEKTPYFDTFHAVSELILVIVNGQKQPPQVCNFIKKETLAQVFSGEFCEIFKNTFFTEHLWRTASEWNYQNWKK